MENQYRQQGDDLKAVFISFNQAYYELILNLLDKLSIKGFSYWDTVQGRGTDGGEPHYGSHAWPTLNGAIMTIVPKEQAKRLLDALREMDQRTEEQGLRAFLWNVEATI